MAILTHITLNTGHVRSSPREEVSDDVVAIARRLLEQSIAGEPVRVPGAMPGGPYHVKVTADGDVALVTLFVLERGDAAPLVTTAVAATEEGARELWDLLHAEAEGIKTDPNALPTAPWCVDRLEASFAAVRPDAAMWTGDFARCVAWAWIAMRQEAAERP